jgi:radical SAM protein with 4Fe4S-binding SPASM domain
MIPALKRGLGVCLNHLSLGTHKIAPRPVGYITIEATRICNLRCQMCNIGKMSATLKSRPPELSPAAWANIFGRSRFLKFMPKIRITGGEPFIRQDLPELACSLLALPHVEEIAIYTNGYFTQRTTDGVKAMLSTCPSNKTVALGVSLDAIGEKHDRIRGKEGAFIKARATLERLCELREEFPQLRVESATVLQADNIADIGDVDALRKHMGVKSHYMIVQNTSFLGNSKEQTHSGTFTSDQRSVIRELARNNDGMVGVNRWLETGMRPMSCYAGTSSTFIGSSGDVYPCVAMAYESAFCMGNVSDGDFDSVWMSSRAGAVRDRVAVCTFSSCWAGCEITATRVQHAPLEFGVKWASFGLLDYYRLRGLR